MKFRVAAHLVKTSGAITSAHALAEAYATLSGDPRLRINPYDADRMVGDLAKAVQVHGLAAKLYLALIREAPANGIRGGSFFDAIHAKTAREARCGEIHTLNVKHFQHVAPDLKIVGL